MMRRTVNWRWTLKVAMIDGFERYGYIHGALFLTSKTWSCGWQVINLRTRAVVYEGLMREDGAAYIDAHFRRAGRISRVVS